MIYTHFLDIIFAHFATYYCILLLKAMDNVEVPDMHDVQPSTGALLFCAVMCALSGFGLIGKTFGFLQGRLRRVWGMTIYWMNSLRAYYRRTTGSPRWILFQANALYIVWWIASVVVGIPVRIYMKVRQVAVACWFYLRHNKLKVFGVFALGVGAGFLWQYRRVKAAEKKGEAEKAALERDRNNFTPETKGELGPTSDLIRRSLLAGCAYISILGCVNNAFSNTLVRDLVWLVGSIFRFLGNPPAVCTEGTPCCTGRNYRGRFRGAIFDCSCPCHDPVETMGDLNVDPFSEEVLRRHRIPVTEPRTEPSLNGLNFSHGGNDQRWNWRKFWRWGKQEDDDMPPLEEVLGGAELIAEGLGEDDVREDISFLRRLMRKLKNFFWFIVNFILSRVTSVNMMIALFALTGFVLGSVIYYYLPYLRRKVTQLRTYVGKSADTVSEITDVDPVHALQPAMSIDETIAAHEAAMKKVELDTAALALNAVIADLESKITVLSNKVTVINESTSTTVQESNNKHVSFDIEKDEDEESPLETKKGKTKNKGKLLKIVKRGRNTRERGARGQDREYQHVGGDVNAVSDADSHISDDEYDIYEYEAPSDHDEPLVEDEEEREWQKKHDDKASEDYISRRYGDYTAYVATDKRWKKESNWINIPDIYSLPEKVSDDANICSDEMFYVYESKGQVKLFLYDCPLCKSSKHPISKCPKNKRGNWKFISKRSGVKIGAAPATQYFETELGYIYNSEKVVFSRTTCSLEQLGQQSKIEGVPIIDVENFCYLTVPIYDGKHDFMHCGIPLGNYLLGPAHGQGTEPLYVHNTSDQKDEWIKLDIAEIAPNVPAIWAPDDLIWYKKPQHMKSMHIGPVPINNGRVYVVGYHNGRLAFSGPRNILNIEDSAVAGARMQHLIHDCSTDNGFSGGAVVNADTGKICAIHLGTRQRNKENYACILQEEPVLEFLRRPPPKKSAPAKVAEAPHLN